MKKNRTVSDVNQAEAEMEEQSEIMISPNIKSSASDARTDLKEDLNNTPTRDYLYDILIELKEQGIKRQIMDNNTPTRDYLNDILMELREQSAKQQTIKKCLVFFTVLTVISLVAGLIVYIRINNIINDIPAFGRY